MNEDQREIEEIVKSCAEDDQLRRIVFNLNEMDIVQRKIFSKKMNIYFLSKKEFVDVQAYKFFKLLLNDEILSVVIDRLKGR